MIRIILLFTMLVPSISYADEGLNLSCKNMLSVLGRNYEPLNFKLEVTGDASISSNLTSETSLFYIKEFIINFDDIDIYTFNKISICKVLINGNWIGFTDKPKELISDYKKFRRQGLIHFHNSIYWILCF